MIFQDPLSSLHPFYKVGWQIVEMIRLHDKGSRSRPRSKRAIELLGSGRHPAARPAGRRLPAPVLRRHAPAGDDRHGDGPEAGADHRDEPTTALDVTVQAQVLELINRFQHEFGTG